MPKFLVEATGQFKSTYFVEADTPQKAAQHGADAVRYDIGRASRIVSANMGVQGLMDDVPANVIPAPTAAQDGQRQGNAVREEETVNIEVVPAGVEILIAAAR